ncbi:MAG: hypothetical protein E6958_16015, partial [Eggerthella sp.]|uniref:hypothetical protein n=1 Tax=Eggerthella sp. TaxID=1929886 RepID=UPI002902C94F
MNILTEIEGYSADADKTVRSSVGSTHVEKVTNTDGITSYRVFVKDATGNDLSVDGALPDGYRFLGWYKNVDGVEVRVSSDPSYTIPADTDLTQQQTYIARFEYRVDYYVASDAQDANEFKNPTLHAERWQRYESAFVELPPPAYYNEMFEYWASYDPGANPAIGAKFTGVICNPEKVASKMTFGGVSTDYAIGVGIDFPGAGSVELRGEPSLTGTTSGSVEVETKPDLSGDYVFRFWTGEGTKLNLQWSDWKETNREKTFHPKGSAYSGSRAYYFQAHYAANVKFEGVLRTDGGEWAVERRYEERVLLNQDTSNAYGYPKAGSSTGVSFTSAASPTDADMQRDGYRFLGWIDKSAIAAGEMTPQEWGYVFDVAGDQYCTSQASRAVPYLLAADAVCTRPMDLYPVYVK